MKPLAKRFLNKVSLRESEEDIYRKVEIANDTRSLNDKAEFIQHDIENLIRKLETLKDFFKSHGNIIRFKRELSQAFSVAQHELDYIVSQFND